MARIDVNEFEWDEDNESHCGEHGLSPWIAEEVRTGEPAFFPNKPGKTATFLMIGPDAAGELWTIAILETEIEGKWRPITGWSSGRPDEMRYGKFKKR